MLKLAKAWLTRFCYGFQCNNAVFVLFLQVQNEEIEIFKVKARGLREQHDTVVVSCIMITNIINLLKTIKRMTSFFLF